jgi:hypothetical protein
MAVPSASKKLKTGVSAAVDYQTLTSAKMVRMTSRDLRLLQRIPLVAGTESSNSKCNTLKVQDDDDTCMMHDASTESLASSSSSWVNIRRNH